MCPIRPVPGRYGPPGTPHAGRGRSPPPRAPQPYHPAVALRSDDLPALPEPVELVGRPIVCRRAGCGELAGATGLCSAHGEHQAHLRAVQPSDTAGTPPLPTLPMSRPTWHHLAACRGTGPARFYPDAAARKMAATDPYRQARKVCETCPVVDECRQAGQSEAHGVWGGQSPSERRQVRRGT